jgi:hypothetical protein
VKTIAVQRFLSLLQTNYKIAPTNAHIPSQAHFEFFFFEASKIQKIFEKNIQT